MRNTRFALRLLLRDWFAGELTMLAVALTVAVASMTSVAFFTDRLQSGMQLQASELIASDLLIKTPRPIRAERLAEAQERKLDTALTSSFRTIVIHNGQPRMVEVKAVNPAYPLRGQLQTADAPFTEGTASTSTPVQGELWADQLFFQQFGANTGDAITLGGLSLRLSKVLTDEPDRAGDLFNVAPRVMISLDDASNSGLMTQGSLVQYQLLLAGDKGAISDYNEWLEINKHADETLITSDEGRPEIRTAFEQADRFLGLAALVSVILAGVAIGSSAQRFVTRHLNAVAIMRSLGAMQNQIVRLFAIEMFSIAIITTLLGSLLGLLLQGGIVAAMDQLILIDLPAPSLAPVVTGFITSLLLLTGFALAPIIALKSVSPLRVLRQSIDQGSLSQLPRFALLAIALGSLLYWQLQDARLVISVAVGAVLTIAVLAGSAWSLIKLLQKLRHRIPIAWRFGITSLTRRLRTTITQVVAFGIAIMMLLLLGVVRTDLLEAWQTSLPPQAPNHFMINVQPDQLDSLGADLQELGVSTTLYPMVRARLVRLNGEIVNANNYDDERTKHLLTREFNLSWADALPPANDLVAGSWWTDEQHQEALISLERKIADRFGVGVGDKVTFEINGSEKSLLITSLRDVDWDTFHVNFFTLVPPKLLEETPASWVTSFHVPSETKQAVGDMLADYPNVTLIDISVILQKVRHLISRISLAIEWIFLFTLVSGFVLMLSAIQTGIEERYRESAVLRTLGASKRTLRGGLLAEFSLLGACAGLLGGTAATTVAWLVAHYVFKFEYQLNLSPIFIGALFGTLIVGLIGYLATRQMLTQPPAVIFRKA